MCWMNIYIRNLLNGVEELELDAVAVTLVTDVALVFRDQIVRDYTDKPWPHSTRMIILLQHCHERHDHVLRVFPQRQAASSVREQKSILRFGCSSSYIRFCALICSGGACEPGSSHSGIVKLTVA